MSSEITLTDLPTEILGLILDYTASNNVPLVCKDWKTIYEDYHVFKANKFFATEKYLMDVYYNDFNEYFDIALESRRKFSSFIVQLPRRNYEDFVDWFDGISHKSKSTVRKLVIITGTPIAVVTRKLFQMTISQFRSMLSFENLSTLEFDICTVDIRFKRYPKFEAAMFELKKVKSLRIIWRKTEENDYNSYAFREELPEIFNLIFLIKMPALQQIQFKTQNICPELVLYKVIAFANNGPKSDLRQISVYFKNETLFYWDPERLYVQLSGTNNYLVNNFLDRSRLTQLKKFEVFGFHNLTFIANIFAAAEQVESFKTNLDLPQLLDDIKLNSVVKLCLCRCHYKTENLVKLSQNFPYIKDLEFCYSTFDPDALENLETIFPNVNYSIQKY